MRNRRTKTLSFLTKLVLCIGFLLFAGNGYAQWDTPAKYKSMKNVKANDKDADLVGKTLYSRYCKSCHGSKGDGMGPKSKGLDTDIRSFASPEFKKLSDGAKYYRAFVGRDEMPNFEKKITDENERWLLINYIKSLK